jgi:molecular chaperone Hsp33
MADQLVRALARGGTVRVVTAVTTDLVREISRRHDASGDGVLALGRASTAALLLATHTKDDHRVTLQIAGDGPLGAVTADVVASGGVRGYVTPPDSPVAEAAAAPTKGSRPSLAPRLGRHGTLGVVRDMGMRSRYRGQSTLVTGEIDEDVEHYLRVSEQIDSAIGCEVVLDAVGHARAACGLLVQTLPDAGAAGAELVRETQHRLRTGELYAALVAAAAAPEPIALATAVLGAGEALQVLDRREPRFSCPCSRERVKAMVKMLDAAELRGLIEAGRPAEIVCNFCRERYEIDLAELALIAAEKGSTSGPRGSS